MAFTPTPQPPDVKSGRFLDWMSQFWRDSTKRGVWTPNMTFATPGDFAKTFSIQAGWYNVNASGLATATFALATSSFTWTTASGGLSITGLPLTASNETNYVAVSTLQWQGITKANYTQWSPYILASGNTIAISGCGSGQANVTLSAADMPSGGSVVLFGTIQFRV